MKKYETNGKQMAWSMEKEEKRLQSAKRVVILSVRLVKEKSLLYKDRSIRSPEDGYNL